MHQKTRNGSGAGQCNRINCCLLKIMVNLMEFYFLIISERFHLIYLSWFSLNLPE